MRLFALFITFFLSFNCYAISKSAFNSNPIGSINDIEIDPIVEGGDSKIDKKKLLIDANGGKAPFQHLLGLCYKKGRCGFPQDLVKARHWLSRAANNNILPAKYTYAKMLHLGEGGEVDNNQAFAQLSAAVKKGHLLSHYALAYFYDNGIGTAINHKVAASLYLKLLAVGHKDSAFEVAKKHISGIGIDQDIAKAKVLLTNLSGSNYPGASALLSELNQNECLKNDGVVVFGLLVNCADRDLISTKMSELNFKTIRHDTKFLHDIFMTKDDKKVVIGFSPNGSLAEIVFINSKPDRFISEYKSKYGQPDKTDFVSGQFKILSFWKLKNSVQLAIKKDKDNAYAHFIVVDNYKAMNEEISRIKSNGQ